MNIAHVVPYIGDEASGPAYSTSQACLWQAKLGMNISLHTLAPCPDVANVAISTYPRHRWPHPSLGRSPEMLAGLRRIAQQTEILHNHSLWMLNNIYPLLAIRNTPCKLVCSPHGTMAPWAWRRSPLKKLIMRKLGQEENLRATVLFHATSEAEYLDIRALGFRQPVAIIPNGIDIPDISNETKPDKNIVLFVGRIHPVKGIDLLLQAWAGFAAQYPDWELQIVGPGGDEAYPQKLKLFTEQRNVPNVRFVGPKFGEEKHRTYQNAQLLILPSHTENFGMVVAEALAHGVPCIATKGTPWQGLHTHSCGWWIDLSVEEIQRTLQEAMSLSALQRTHMGLQGRAWMQREFGWRDIAKKMGRSYEWTLHGGERPSWIQTD